MSYYSKPITENCNCAMWYDTLWFLDHPERCMNLRVPYECEAADLKDQPHVTQVIVVAIPKSLRQQADDANLKNGLLDIGISRHSFLFIGTADAVKTECDDQITQFLKLIDDNYAASGARN